MARTRTGRNDQRGSGRFARSVAVPGVSTYGRWRPFTWDNDGCERHGVELIPDHAPWRDLFRVLDAAGERLSDAPVEAVEEATAAVACCLRYGTYFHVLTAGEYFPEFAKNEGLSRISDDEMKRINIEFSSALAEWWRDRAADPGKVWRRTRAAHALLSVTWGADPFVIEAVGEAFGERVLTLSEESPISSAGEATTRQEANYAVLQAYRNGQIEGLHAGTWSLGRDIPGFVRLYASEARSICSVASELLGGIIFCPGSRGLCKGLPAGVLRRRPELLVPQ